MKQHQGKRDENHAQFDLTIGKGIRHHVPGKVASGLQSAAPRGEVQPGAAPAPARPVKGPTAIAPRVQGRRAAWVRWRGSAPRCEGRRAAWGVAERAARLGEPRRGRVGPNPCVYGGSVQPVGRLCTAARGREAEVEMPVRCLSDHGEVILQHGSSGWDRRGGKGARRNHQGVL